MIDALNSYGFSPDSYFIYSFFSIVTCFIILFGLFLYSQRPNLVISIKTKAAQPAVDIRRNDVLARNMGLIVFVPIGWIIMLLALVAKLKDSNPVSNDSGFAEVMPTPETEGAIREINAMINDIQKLGDFGLEKWKQ